MLCRCFDGQIWLILWVLVFLQHVLERRRSTDVWECSPASSEWMCGKYISLTLSQQNEIGICLAFHARNCLKTIVNNVVLSISVVSWHRLMVVKLIFLLYIDDMALGDLKKRKRGYRNKLCHIIFTFKRAVQSNSLMKILKFPFAVCNPKTFASSSWTEKLFQNISYKGMVPSKLLIYTYITYSMAKVCLFYAFCKEKYW